MSERLSSALEAAHRRAAFSPDRIVVGQVGISHSQALRLVEAGLWQLAEMELCKGKYRQRYRLTDIGRAALRSDGGKDHD